MHGLHVKRQKMCPQGLFLYTYPDILRHWNVVISEFWRFWSEFWRFWSEFWWFYVSSEDFDLSFFVNFDLSFGFLMTFGDFCLIFGEFWGNHSIISIDTQSKCRKIWVLPFSDLSFGKKISEFWKIIWVLEFSVIWVLASAYKKNPLWAATI